jgi:DNA-binding response OmpR family regulator
VRVLLVEPDLAWAEAVAAALSAESVRVDTVLTLYAARAAAAFHPCDVVVVALTLPDGSGLDLCRELDGATVRRIVVTPTGSLQDRVAAFEAGADDVVSQADLSLRELALRVRAVGRRTRSSAPPEDRREDDGAIRVDERGTVEVDGRVVQVSSTERAILVALLSRPGRVMDRATLRQRVWGDDDVQERTVDSAVKRLRARLGGAGARIETVRGVGYRLDRLDPE